MVAHNHGNNNTALLLVYSIALIICDILTAHCSHGAFLHHRSHSYGLHPSHSSIVSSFTLRNKISYTLSSRTDSDIENDNYVTTNSSTNQMCDDNNDSDSDSDDMPWGKYQEWALRDNLPKYIVHIPQLASKKMDPNFDNAMDKTSNKIDESSSSVFALWRTLIRETPELMGYDVQFVRKMHLKQLRNDLEFNTNKIDKDGNYTINTKDDKNSAASPSSLNFTSSPRLLPQLDLFEFQTNGGLSGITYGLPGIADGTSIQTSSLVHVQLTVPKGYVLTNDKDAVAFELGLPLSLSSSNPVQNQLIAAMNNSRNKIMDVNKVPIPLMNLQQNTDGISNSLSSRNIGGGMMNDSEANNQMLMNVGSTAMIALGSAAALNMLSHHLTVNFFWV